MAGNNVIGKTYTFSAGHRLLSVPEGHKCRRIHGHTYTLRVELSSSHLTEGGFVLEYSELDALVKPLVEQFDHYFMVQKGDPLASVLEKMGEEIRVLDAPPTAEILAALFWDVFSREIDGWSEYPDDPARIKLHRIVVQESPTSFAEKSR